MVPCTGLASPILGSPQTIIRRAITPVPITDSRRNLRTTPTSRDDDDDDDADAEPATPRGTARWFAEKIFGGGSPKKEKRRPAPATPAAAPAPATPARQRQRQRRARGARDAAARGGGGGEAADPATPTPATAAAAKRPILAKPTPEKATSKRPSKVVDRWAQGVEAARKQEAERVEALKTRVYLDSLVRDRLRALELRLGEVPERFRAMIHTGATVGDLIAALEARLRELGGDVAEVFVFHSNNYNEAAGDYKLWDWSKVTTVAVWKDRLLEEPDIVPFARAQGAKVVLGGFGMNAEHFSNASARAYVGAVVNLTSAFRLDGFNVDIEGNAPEHRDAVTALTCDLKAALGPASMLTFDLGAAPKSETDRYDFAGLGVCLDYIVPMIYDMVGGWPELSPGPNSPLGAVRTCVEEYSELGIPPSRLILGFPWYGYDFPCAAGTPAGSGGACVMAQPPPPFLQLEAGYGTVLDTWERRGASVAGAGVSWDNTSSTPWFEYAATDGSIHQCWSLALCRAAAAARVALDRRLFHRANGTERRRSEVGGRADSARPCSRQAKTEQEVEIEPLIEGKVEVPCNCPGSRRRAPAAGIASAAPTMADSFDVVVSKLSRVTFDDDCTIKAVGVELVGSLRPGDRISRVDYAKVDAAALAARLERQLALQAEAPCTLTGKRCGDEPRSPRSPATPRSPADHCAIDVCGSPRDSWANYPCGGRASSLSLTAPPTSPASPLARKR
ncbi:hypothetical protein JL722_3732 [Aureococcus anophagefferens]|nr:hypothetical protein JL722_3732 [Aureococcus anophagefferens]